MASTNTSDITVSASTWTKVCSIDVSSSAKGRYLAIGSIGHPVAAENNVYYVRISRDNSVDSTILNTPYGNDNIIGIVDTSNIVSTVDLWLYGKSHTLTRYYGALRLVRLFE